MHEERGQIGGDLTITEAYTLWGSVGGSVTVSEGGKLYMRGAIYGNLIAEYGARIHIFGRIIGNLTVKRGAKVIHSGVLGGDAINEGGRLFIENTAVIEGKVKTIKGDTQIKKLLDGGPSARE